MQDKSYKLDTTGYEHSLSMDYGLDLWASGWF